jgi:hypothetical protein
VAVGERAVGEYGELDDPLGVRLAERQDARPRPLFYEQSGWLTAPGSDRRQLDDTRAFF